MPDRLDLGSRPLPGAYWMHSGRHRVPYRPGDEQVRTGRYRHVFSYEGSPATIKEAALELIDRAERKIFLASFRFKDADLREALKKAARRLGGGVYVITSIVDRDLRATLSSDSLDLEDDEDDLDTGSTAAGVDAEEENKRYADLVRSGIWVRGHPEFHAKFLVVDDAAALVSSANLETSALTDVPGRAVTGENGVVLDDPAQAETLGRFFTHMWFEQCVWDAPPGTAYQHAHRTPSQAPCTVPEPVRCPGPIWTSPGELSILRTIHHVIDEAQRDLLLASFSLNGLIEDPDLLHEPLRAALGRGVRVRLLVRSRNFAATRAEAAALAELGVEVYGDDKTHAKCAIADGRTGALFSANFDAAHGLYSGVEMGVRLDGEPALTDAVRFFDHCIAHAPQTLEREPTHRRASESLASRTLTRWPWPDQITLTCRAEHWTAFTAAPGPVLFSLREASDDHLTLHAAGGKWLLSKPRNDRPGHLELIDRPSPAEDTALLDTWLAGSRRGSPPDPYENHLRGLCPATLIRPGDGGQRPRA